MNDPCKLVVLEKILCTTSLLKRSSVWQKNHVEDNHIAHQLRELQIRLRGNAANLLHAIDIVSPFILILKSQHLSGPFKLSALDTLQTFLSKNVFLHFNETQICETLYEIVQAVSKCKFPQTDVVGDDLVYFTLIETLYCIVRSPVKHFLSNDSIWEITTRCYSNIFTSSGPMRTNRQHGNNADNGSSRALLVQLSEKALISAVQLVFSSDSVEFWKKVKERTATAKSGAGLSVEKEMETGGEAKGVGPPLFTSYNRISSSALNEGSGLPETSNAKRMLPFDEVGAMKVFRFFVAMLSRYTTLFSCLSEQNTGSGVGLVPSSNGASSKTSSARHFANLHTSSTSSSSKVSASLSGGCICLNDDIGGIYNSIYTVDRSKSVKEMTENDVALARSIIGSSSGISEMLLSLKVIKSVLTSSNGTSAIQQICISYPEFVWEISDSLGKCLILLATKRSYPSIVLQYILSIFGELVAAMSPVLKVLVENFVTQVYLKALHQVLCCLVEHDAGRGVYNGSIDGLAMKLQNLHIPVSKIVDSSSAFDGSPIRSPAIHTPQSASKAGGTKSGLCENPAYVSAMVFNYEELVVILEHLSDLISGCPGLVTSLYASFDCDPLKSDLLQPMIVYLTQSSRFSLLSNAYGTYSGDGVKHGSRSNLNAVEAGGYKLRNSDNPFTFKQLQSLSTLCRHAVNELLHKLAGNIPQATTTDESGDVEISPIVESGKRGGFMANYLCFSRDSKSLLIEATKLFIEKPSKAFSFLRAKGCLPAAPPLSPCFAAKFLRSLSNAKEAIGAFIGELGKKDALHECDSEEFRTAVRQEYVNTFHFTDQSVLDCVRIFLSAFRLPGEAQQIDRILVAFSEKCHMSCEEGKSGLLENAEVTYLLTFSIIMLNTDCHNPNIRADRKMTLAQFIRNNSNYGKDVNQTKPLSNEFLESIYSSISEFPLRTENTDVSGELTKEMWMDYQLQCEQNLDMSMMVNTHVDVDCLEGLKKSMQCGVAMRHHVAEHGEVVVDCVDNDGKAAASEDFQCKDAANAVLQMLTSKIPVIDPVRISSRIHGLHSFLDTEILKFVWIHFIGLAISPFLCHLIVVPEMVVSMDANGNTVVVVSNYNAQLSSEQYVSINSNNTSGISNNAPRTPGPANGSLADEEGGVAANIKLEFPVAEQYEHNTVSAQALRKAVDILTSLIELCHVHGLFDEVDMILSLLSDLAGGFLQGKLIDRFVDKYCPDIGYKLMSSSQHEYYRNKRMYYSTLMLPSAISRNAEISVPMKGVNEQSAAVIPNRRHSTGDLHHATDSSSPMSGVGGIEDADVDANNNGSACMLYENRSASVTTSYEVWVHDEFLNDMAIQCRKRDIFVHIITESIRARAALGTFLQLIIHSPRYVRSSTWVIVWYMLGLLRDCSLLSGEMVLLDNDGDDALPNECKEQFENTLKHTMLAVERSLIGSDKRFRLKQVYAKQQEEKRLEQKQKALNIGGSVASQSPGVIYGLFQGIGDVLFGADESMSEGNDDALAEKSDIVITEDMVVAEWLHFGDSLHHALLAGKWDAGYDFCRVKTAIARNPADTEFKKLRGSQSGKDELEGNANSLASVRELILVCGCSQLIASSRYFSDETLVSFVSSLIMLSEMSPSTLHAPVDASKSSNQSFDQLLVSRSLTDSENIALANYLVSGSRASSGSSDGIVDNDDSELVANHHRSSATPRHSTPSGTPAKSFDFETPISSTYTLPADLRQADSLHTMLQDVLTKENVIMKPSSSTVAWLESVIIEISLRNRDRIATLIWPLLNQHYRVTIGGGINEGYPDQSNSKSCRIISPVALSYSLERRVAGVFKIATKMLSRGGDELRDDIMSLLQDLFVVVSGGGITTVTPGATVVSDFNPPKPTEYAGNASEKGSTHTVEITLDDSMGAGVNAVVVSETEVALSNSFSSPNDMAQTPAQTLSNQIAGHMWKFLTGNVSVLPLLSLKQWQTIFDIINATAGADQYAAVKSFECMAWMLHDSRLRAEVPIFCVSAIQPLLNNTNAPVSVNLGAVQLLCLLHERLDVLVEQNPTVLASDEVEDDDIPSTWETCWLPVLRDMASAYENPNVSVRLSCVKSLCKCLVIDKHATVAPPKVIMTCISSIFIPIVKDLLESLKSMSFRCPALEKGIDEMPFEVGVVDRAVAITTATIEDANADQDADEVIRKEEQTPAHTASENEANESKNNESDKSTSEYLKVVEDAFVALCQLFTLQSKRILHYPSFDKLWFQLLDVLGIILKDVTYPFPNLDDKLEGSVSNKDGVEHNSKSLCPHSTKISNMQNVANDQLKNILMITVVSGIFHKKPVLWELTCEYIHAHYKYCPNITDELFVNGNLANPSESFIATPFKR